MSHNDVIVFGSANLDEIDTIDHLPVPGETVLSRQRLRSVGGKGANQALAAAAAGVTTRFIGAVGDDDAGRLILGAMSAADVDTDQVLVMDDDTGSAVIAVDAKGENHIIVRSGANALQGEERAAAVLRRLSPESVLVLQAELPIIAVDTAARGAAAAGNRVVLNLAPFDARLVEAAHCADPLVVNRTELEALTGIAVHTPEDVTAMADRLREVARSIVVTLGADGSVVCDPDTLVHIPAERIADVVDATGAGDAFVGVLAAALSRGADLTDAARHATAAAAQCVRFPGAASSYHAIRRLSGIVS